MIAFNPFLTFYDTANANARSRMQGAGGDVVLMTESYLNGSVPSALLDLKNSGNVGIGTGSPGAKLDVRGDIRLGSAGQYLAVGGGENLRIIRGVVTMTQCCVAPTISAGSGFDVSRIGAGTFVVTFTTPFASRPALVATCRESVGGGIFFTTTEFVSSSGGRVITGSDRSFDFVAIGPR